MERTEIRLAGFGGQGVILAGMIIGRAAAIYENLEATLVQSFGPEARGGACSAQVVIASEPVAYPYIDRSDMLVVMSQEASTLFAPRVKQGGLILYEQDLVEASSLPPSIRALGVPATRIAEDLRRRMILNIVMVGFFAAVSMTLGREALENAVRTMVPPGTETLNLKAFDHGFRHGAELIAREGKP